MDRRSFFESAAGAAVAALAMRSPHLPKAEGIVVAHGGRNRNGRCYTRAALDEMVTKAPGTIILEHPTDIANDGGFAAAAGVVTKAYMLRGGNVTVDVRWFSTTIVKVLAAQSLVPLGHGQISPDGSLTTYTFSHFELFNGMSAFQQATRL